MIEREGHLLPFPVPWVAYCGESPAHPTMGWDLRAHPVCPYCALPLDLDDARLLLAELVAQESDPGPDRGGC